MIPLLVAGLMSLLLCSTSHYLANVLSHGRLGPLPRYVLGTLAIGLPFGAWCMIQPGPIQPGWVVPAWAASTVGAGAGTCIAYLADHLAGQAREIRVLSQQVRRGE